MSSKISTKLTQCRLNTYLSTFQPENRNLLNTMRLRPKKECVYKKKECIFDFLTTHLIFLDIWTSKKDDRSMSVRAVRGSDPPMPQMKTRLEPPGKSRCSFHERRLSTIILVAMIMSIFNLYYKTDDNLWPLSCSSSCDSPQSPRF